MENEIRKRLFQLKDEEYKSFHSALMPTVPVENIIGIRVPVLRKLAKELIKEGSAKSFTENLPHRYYEENNLHAFIIAEIRDFDELLTELERFLPFIDNWATCDSLRPVIFRKNREKLLPCVFRWLQSDREFTVRFAVETLMTQYLKEDFSPRFPEAVANIISDDYYVNMMCAWYFAEALCVRRDDVLPFIEEGRLSDAVHNKAIRKAVESNRISDDEKQLLRKLIRK